MSDEIREQIIRELTAAGEILARARTEGDNTIALLDAPAEVLRGTMDSTASDFPGMNLGDAQEWIIEVVTRMSSVVSWLAGAVRGFNRPDGSIELSLKAATSVAVVTDGTGDDRPEKAIAQASLAQIGWSNAVGYIAKAAEMINEAMRETAMHDGTPVVEALKGVAATLRLAEDSHHEAGKCCDNFATLTQSYISKL